MDDRQLTIPEYFLSPPEPGNRASYLDFCERREAYLGLEYDSEPMRQALARGDLRAFDRLLVSRLYLHCRYVIDALTGTPESLLFYWYGPYRAPVHPRPTKE